MVRLTDQQQQNIGTTVSIVAYRLSSKYRDFTEASDIGQNLWVWLLAKPRRLAPLLDAVEADDVKREMKFLEKNLYRQGDIDCRIEKAKITGYRHTDEFFYSQSLIIALLQARANDGVMPVEQTSSKVKRSKTLSEGMDIEAMLSDLEAALDKFDPDQVEFLNSLYGMEIPPKTLAEQRDVTRQAVEARGARLIEKLIDELGGLSPYARA